MRDEGGMIGQELAGSMIDPGQQKSLLVDLQSEDAAASAEAANAPRRTAASAACATTTTASPTATAATATAAAAATAAAPGHLLHAALAILLVEEVEGRKADVGDLFFAKHKALIGDSIEGLRDICCRQRGCGCAPRQRKAESSSTQSRHCGCFGDTLPLRSLFHP